MCRSPSSRVIVFRVSRTVNPGNWSLPSPTISIAGPRDACFGELPVAPAPRHPAGIREPSTHEWASRISADRLAKPADERFSASTRSSVSSSMAIAIFFIWGCSRVVKPRHPLVSLDQEHVRDAKASGLSVGRGRFRQRPKERALSRSEECSRVVRGLR